jgi:ubiquinone/menaquinone biosynthesis C-methylase UbiE
MRPLIRERVLTLAAVAVLAGYDPGVSGQRQDDAADTARLIEVLDIREGSRVADVGAGSGQLSIPIARHVGQTGMVYSTDVNPKRLEEIRDSVQKAELRNVTVVEGGSTRTNLPQECCDAIFMRHVYHHIGDLTAMNANLRASLKPGGRLGVVDFAPRGDISAPPGRRDTEQSHGVTPEAVIEELRAAGLVEVQQLPWSSAGGFLVVGQRPR